MDRKTMWELLNMVLEPNAVVKLTRNDWRNISIVLENLRPILLAPDEPAAETKTKNK